MSADYDILVSRRGPAVWTAGVAGGTLTDIEVDPADAKHIPRTGDLYAARIGRVLAERQVAFLDLGDAAAFLNLRRSERKSWPVEGQTMIVQITAEAGAGKEAEATIRPVLAGSHVLFAPGASGHHFSRRIASIDRPGLAAELLANTEPGEGAIVRHSAADAPSGTIAAELRALRAEWRDLCAELPKNPGILRRELPAAARLAREIGPARIARILVDDGALLRSLTAALRALGAGFETRMALHSSTEGLFDWAGIADAVGDAMARRLTLADGAELVFDEAEAVIAIDVDSATASDNPAAINFLAAREVVRQIRLRNLSGLIVVDFLRLETREARDRLLAALREAIRHDPVTADVLGFTRGGLVEITRRRLRPSLRTTLAALGLPSP